MLKKLLSDTDSQTGRDNRFKATLLIGYVAELVNDENGANVRVIFPDRVDHTRKPLITKPIPVLQVSAGGKRTLAMPRVGQMALVGKLPNATGDYFLLGTFYTTSKPPPTTDPKLDYSEYEDGSTIVFNATTGTMAWDLKGGITMECQGDITIRTEGHVLLDAPNIKLQGEVEIDGDITHTGNMNTSGVHTDANGVHQ